jgi:peptide-methionine (R)-S-oxide reductase
MKRRNFVTSLLALFAVHRAAQAGPQDSVRIEKLKLSDDEWRKRLAPQSYSVLRHEDTERPGSSPLNGEHRKGTFVCAGCDLPLFTSAMKFESGTGWPSFTTFIPGHLEMKTDFKLIAPRTEYHCARCEGHQGHVFDDGPPPTGKRYCNNGVALKFVAA